MKNSTVKLSDAQSRCLGKLKAETEKSKTSGLKKGLSSYELQESLATLESLERKGLVTSVRGMGSIAFPHNNIKWFEV